MSESRKFKIAPELLGLSTDEEILCFLHLNRYLSNGALAISIIDMETGENYQTLSVNLMHDAHQLKEKEFFLRPHLYKSPLITFLEQEKLLKTDEVSIQPLGSFNEYRIYKLI